MNKVFTAFLSLVFLLGAIQVQAQTFNQYLKRAEEAFQQEDYFSAMQLYAFTLEVKEDRTDLLYQYAESARLFSAFIIADSAYQKVIEQAAEGEFIDATWKLAMVKKQLGDYDAAGEAFREFATITPDAELAKKAMAEAEACKWAQEIADNPTKGLNIDTLGETINTPFSEYYPVPYEDKLYYTSLSYFPEEDIHDPVRPVMKIMKSLSLKPGDLDPGINDDSLHTAYMTFNTDYSRVYYCLCSYRTVADIQCELYFRNIMEDAELGPATKLPDNINVIGHTNSQPNIGKDKETGKEYLFYVSDRPEGKGGMDVWCAIIDENGGFSAPYPVADINTEEDDATPFFHNESQNLYFASKGHKGLGGFDLFRAEKEGDNYLEPENLGSPTNSSFNDISIYLGEDETSGFLASNRQGSVTFDGIREYCCYDIFGFQQTVARLKIELFACDREQDIPVYNADVALYEIDENGAEIFMEKITSESNIYTKVVQRNKKYRVVAIDEGYQPAEYVYDLTGTNPLLDISLRLSPDDISLDISVFQKENKNALLEATIQLEEDGQQIAIDTKEESNLFQYSISRNKEYRVIASKPGYHPDTLLLDLASIGAGCTYLKRIELLKKDLLEYPPLYLYFDNDSPDPKTTKRTTNKTYEQAFEDYYARKPIFIDEFTKVLKGEDRFLAEQQVKAFFEREVKEGYESLIVFLETALEYLKDDVAIVITIRGYASPRASSFYNERLTNRRINSLLNQVNTFQGGALKPYLASGLLKIIEVPIGEGNVNPVVSDRLEDERNSIFSPLASKERRVEIIGVTTNENQ